MTVQALVAAATQAGIVLAVEDDRLKVRGPAGALTPELRDALTVHKPSLLPVLSRLDGMQANADRVPIPCAVIDAKGGPGRCFSCGLSLGHPESYGRCLPCAVASELFYAARAAGQEMA